MDTNSKQYRKEYQLACEIMKMRRHVDKKEAAKERKVERQAQAQIDREVQTWFDMLRQGVK